MANEKQSVLTDDDGVRYVMGVEGCDEVPCRMPVVNECVCGFEWPDVLTPSEVKALKQGKGCPECTEGKTIVKTQVGDVEYTTV